MARKGRARFQCGHVGFGGYCHRCKAADDLEARGGQQNLEEARRLRGPSVSKTNRGKSASQISLAEAPTE